MIGVLLLVATGCAHHTGSPLECASGVVATLTAAIPDTTGQLMVALPLPGETAEGTVFLFKRSADGWLPTAGPLPAMLGRNGFARPGEKREGDGRTPAGLFPLESAFGSAPAVATRMPYRQATVDDLWVDDAAAPDYNQWVKRGQTSATSFEEMKRADHRYSYGLVTGYNRQPVVPGFGSAIFVHVWQDPGVSTSGCVALSEPDMISILTWLDPAEQPLLLMGEPRQLTRLTGGTAAVIGCAP